MSIVRMRRPSTQSQIFTVPSIDAVNICIGFVGCSASAVITLRWPPLDEDDSVDSRVNAGATEEWMCIEVFDTEK